MKAFIIKLATKGDNKARMRTSSKNQLRNLFRNCLFTCICSPPEISLQKDMISELPMCDQCCHLQEIGEGLQESGTACPKENAACTENS
jgi:hypothetical protein